MAEQDGKRRRRLDHDLYAAEGVVVLGAAVFLIGFGVDKNSNTPGRALEAAGFIVFALGLFASATIGYFLSRHFARTCGDSLAEYANNAQMNEEIDSGPPYVGLLTSGVHQAVNDPAVPLMSHLDAEPEDDASRDRLIERGRRGTEGGGQDRFGDQLFTE